MRYLNKCIENIKDIAIFAIILLLVLYLLLGYIWTIIIVISMLLIFCIVIFFRFGTKRAKIKRKADVLRDNEIRKLTMMGLKHKEKLFSLSPYEFETSIAAMYDRLGYKVAQTPYSGDFGIDIMAWKNGEKYIIECKKYRPDRKIGYPILQRLHSAMIEKNADKATCVTTSDFAKTAYDYIENKNIDLVNLDKLIMLMCKAFENIEDDDFVRVMCLKCGDIVNFEIADAVLEKKCSNGHIVINNLNDIKLSPKILLDKIYCNECGKEMQLRTGPYGKFWGCEGYPKCKNKKSYEISQK